MLTSSSYTVVFKGGMFFVTFCLLSWTMNPFQNGLSPTWSGDLFNPLYTAFHYHLPIYLSWPKYCWKGCKLASHGLVASLQRKNFLLNGANSFIQEKPQWYIVSSVCSEMTEQWSDRCAMLNHKTLHHQVHWATCMARNWRPGPHTEREKAPLVCTCGMLL